MKRKESEQSSASHILGKDESYLSQGEQIATKEIPANAYSRLSKENKLLISKYALDLYNVIYGYKLSLGTRVSTINENVS